jgi:DNA-binding NarL/FixJ family response regulator
VRPALSAVSRRLIEDFCKRPPPTAGLPPPRHTSANASEVLRLLARGLSYAEIAAQLYLSDATVKSHVARILAKLDLRDRVQIVVFAYESGIIRPGGAS